MSDSPVHRDRRIRTLRNRECVSHQYITQGGRLVYTSAQLIKAAVLEWQMASEAKRTVISNQRWLLVSGLSNVTVIVHSKVFASVLGHLSGIIARARAQKR